jgi:hypothetical protein
MVVYKLNHLQLLTSSPWVSGEYANGDFRGGMHPGDNLSCPIAT